MNLVQLRERLLALRDELGDALDDPDVVSARLRETHPDESDAIDVLVRLARLGIRRRLGRFRATTAPTKLIKRLQGALGDDIPFGYRSQGLDEWALTTWAMVHGRIPVDWDGTDPPRPRRRANVARGGRTLCDTAAYGVAIVRGGEWVAWGGPQPAVARVDGQGDPIVLRVPEDHEGHVHAMRDNCRLITYGRDAAVRVWDAEDGSELQRIENLGGRVFGVAELADENTILVQAGGRIQRVRLEDGAVEDSFAYAESRPKPFAVIADAEAGELLILVASARYRIDGALEARRVADGKVLWTIDSGGAPIQNMEPSPDGVHLLLAFGKSMKPIDLTAREGRALFRKGQQGSALAIGFDATGSKVVTGAARNVHIFDFESRQETLRLRGHKRPVTGVAVAPDMRFVVSAGLDRVVVWDQPLASR